MKGTKRMFDVNEFNKAVLERNFNYSTLAKEIGITEKTLRKKVNQTGNFTIKEINAIQEILLLNMVELNNIFFK